MPQTATHEKRLARRVPVPAGDYVVHTCTRWAIRNLSASGIFIEDTDPLPPGSPLYLQLHLSKQQFDVSGVVRRSVPGEGMGVQFVNLPRDVQAQLERYVNIAAKSLPAQERTAAAPQPPAPAVAALPSPSAPPKPPPTAGGDVATDLQKLSVELLQMEERIMAGDVDARVLREFRDSVDQIRVTAWAVQKWTELQSCQGDTYSVLPLISRERIRRAAKLSEDLVLDIDGAEIDPATEDLTKLNTAVQRLAERLNRLFRK